MNEYEEAINTLDYMLTRIPFNQAQEKALNIAKECIKAQSNIIHFSPVDDWFSYENE